MLLSAFYPPSAFSHPRFILHPHFLIRVLSSIHIFSSAFYPPSAFSHPYFLIRNPYPPSVSASAFYPYPLQEYEFVIIHRPGRSNDNAGTLSRFPQPPRSQIVGKVPDDEVQVGVAGTYVCSSWTQQGIRTTQRDDPSILPVIERLKQTEESTESEETWKQNGEPKRYNQLLSQLIMTDEILYRRVGLDTPEEKIGLVVPRKMRTDLLKSAHSDPSAGHMGVKRCLER